MAFTPVTFAGVTYQVPGFRDTGWSGATGVDGLLIALGTNANVYGQLTGTLSDQTDLQTALDAKASTTSLTSGLATKEPVVSVFDNGDTGAAFEVDWDNGQFQTLVFTDDCTLTFTNWVIGRVYVLQAYQDGVGSRIPTLPVNVAYPSQTSPTFTTKTNRADNLILFTDGTTIFASYTLNYKAYNPNFDPSQIDDNAFWWDGADSASMTLSGALITQWRDKSGNARHLNTTGTDRATLTSNALNSKSAVTFDRTNFYTIANAGAGVLANTGVGFTYYFVLKQDSYPGAPGYVGLLCLFQDENGVTNSLNLGFGDGINGLSDNLIIGDNLNHWAYTKVATWNNGSSTFRRLVVTYNGSGATTRGNYAAEKDGVGQSLAAGVTIGVDSISKFGGNSSSGLNFLGSVAEAAGYARELDSDEIDTLDTYVLSKWGI